MDGEKIPTEISDQLDLMRVLRKSASVWDGGYAIAGLVGNGDFFVMRDPKGIRPAHYFENDEVIAVASERVPLMTVFNIDQDAVSEIPPGHAITMKRHGELKVEAFCEPQERTSCSFERIYFSRGNDPEIYNERKALGGALAPRILKEINGNLADAIFSFIPNTAETASYGLLGALRRQRRLEVATHFKEARAAGTLERDFDQLLDELVMENWPRAEKIAHKDIKLRTFIANESGRSKMVSHVYDISYGVVEPKDTLVVIDDSIVRGTTLRESIISILTRTNPKKIIVASTAPQIRYPDCYGIDMSELGKFIAFQAAMELHKKRGTEERLAEIYRACLAEIEKPLAEQRNCVQDVYAEFSADDISEKISKMLYPKTISWSGELKIVYQTIEDLHASCPEHIGDWYFTGNYPTPGGTGVCNKAFINYFENRTGRAY